MTTMNCQIIISSSTEFVQIYQILYWYQRSHCVIRTKAANHTHGSSLIYHGIIRSDTRNYQTSLTFTDRNNICLRQSFNGVIIGEGIVFVYRYSVNRISVAWRKPRSKRDWWVGGNAERERKLSQGKWESSIFIDFKGKGFVSSQKSPIISPEPEIMRF